VLTSRNVRGGRFVDLLLGGLNYQIEHHLFPAMPRVHFGRARALVKPFCAEQGLEYDEVDPLTSYRMVIGELARVGHAADGPLFDLEQFV